MLWFFNLALIVSVPCVPKEMKENTVLQLKLAWVQGEGLWEEEGKP